jgi:hypothetical protein
MRRLQTAVEPNVMHYQTETKIKGNVLNNLRLHIWFMANVALLLGLYFYPNLVKTPFPLAFILLSLILKTKTEIKKEYTAKISWYGVLLTLLVPILLVLSAMFGYTQYLNSLATVENTKFSILVFALILLLLYVYLNIAYSKAKKT